MSNEHQLDRKDLGALLGAGRFVAAMVGSMDIIIPGLRVESARKDLVEATAKLEQILLRAEQGDRQREAEEAKRAAEGMEKKKACAHKEKAPKKKAV